MLKIIFQKLKYFFTLKNLGKNINKNTRAIHRTIKLEDLFL
jgi:hypothetical protein